MQKHSPVSVTAMDPSLDILDDSLEHFLQRMPNGSFLLQSMGIETLLNAQELSELAPYLPLRDVLHKLKADPETFLRHLTACTAGSHVAAASGYAPVEADTPHMEANVPCALKAPLEIAFQEAATAQARSTGTPVTVTVQSENETSISNQGDRIDRLEDIPALIMAAGYNSLLDQAFQKRWATEASFAPRPWPVVNDRLATGRFADPLGIYRTIGVNVFVFVADPARLNGRPAPDSWETLLSDPFVQDVVVCGSGDKASGSLMLHIQHHFGADGLRRMGRNVKSGMHPSQVIKHLGTGKPTCPAVAVMPYFFARLAGIRHPAAVIWPRDGAPAMPFFLLVKRQTADAVAGFVDHLEGAAVGHICSGAYFPSLHPAVPYPLPDEAHLTWLGWDTIRNHDLDELRREATRVFEDGHREARG